MSSESDSSKLLEETRIQNVLNSDASLDALLTRLKQSISTGEEFAKYVKKKAVIEDDHHNQLKKFSSTTRATMQNSTKLKNDSFSSKLDKIIGFDGRLSDVGSSYVKALNTMYDELTSLINTVSRNRKTIKDEGKRKEKDCADAITAAEKSRQKYNHVCDDLERWKADPSKKSFSLKSKSSEQQEDDLQRKVDLADQDYKTKVATAKKLKDEITMLSRPATSKRLKNLILEMDIAMNIQLQKYATWNETLIMNSGALISPLQDSKQSMRALASSVDNEKDLYDYLIKFEKTPTNKALALVEYKVHPSLAKTQTPNKPFLNNPKESTNQSRAPSGASGGPGNSGFGSSGGAPQTSNNNGTPKLSSSQNTSLGAPASESSAPTSFSNNSGPPQQKTPNLAPPSSSGPTSNIDRGLQAPPTTYNSLDPASLPSSPELNGPKAMGGQKHQPTFGVSIEDVIHFAGLDNVPLVVRKCIEMIELYGLDIEGIYRTSGNKTTVSQLRSSIDKNYTNYLLITNQINPNNVKDADVFSVASLLKLYFASLPEPLLTNEYCQSFIETVKSLDETFIAKKLHHLVFNLPDGAYFTLRALVFHLNKVAAHQSFNRMTPKNLAIIWGPAILNDNSAGPQDLSYKSKVVEELMMIANDIFDTDD